jgi:hypothetical protein
VEAVPATSGAQRTVRLAAALVAGQVVLVAVIGWVIFACAGDRSAQSGDAALDPLAAPPAQILPAPAAASPAPRKRVSESPAPPTHRGPGANGQPSRPARPASTPPVAETAGPPRWLPLVPAPTITTPPGPLTLAPPPSPPAPPPPASPVATANPTAVSGASPSAATASPSASPRTVLAGWLCGQIYARARSDDGWTVRCLPARDHHLRWKIV